MSNKIKDIDTNNQTYHFFDDIIDVKCCNPNKIKIDEKSYKNIQNYYTGYLTIKDLKHIKINKSFMPYYQQIEWILLRNKWK